MKKILLGVFLFVSIVGFSQQSLNIEMLGHYDDDTLPTHTLGTFNDIWGYADGDGREYAIMGSANFIHFFDVTDPTNPIQIHMEPGGANTVWRDFKVYQDHVYAVSDNSGEGLIIFDVSTLPDSVSKTYQSADFFDSAHNIFIDEPNGRLYVAGSNEQNSGLTVLDIATDPDQPQLLGSVNLISGLIGGVVHDLYVRDNIAYCSHGDTGSFVIWDFTDAANPVYIASYESNGYNHSNWVSDDGNTVIFAEEVPTGLPMGLLDISDKENDNLTLYNYFKFPLLAPEHEDATPHNPFILGDLAITSYYEDGVQVFDISDPNNPTRVAYYDTYPSNTIYNGYQGCWGVYPFLPSGNIIASDVANGLFVLRLQESSVSADEIESIESFSVFPNPASDQINVEIETSNNQEIQFEVLTLTGQLIHSETKFVFGKDNIKIDLENLPSGIYILNTLLDGGQISEKIVKY